MSATLPAATWTGRLRDRATRDFPPDQLLPDKQPVYVAPAACGVYARPPVASPTGGRRAAAALTTVDHERLFQNPPRHVET